jgi:hypothetical protein
MKRIFTALLLASTVASASAFDLKREQALVDAEMAIAVRDLMDAYAEGALHVHIPANPNRGTEGAVWHRISGEYALEFCDHPEISPETKGTLAIILADTFPITEPPRSEDGVLMGIPPNKGPWALYQKASVRALAAIGRATFNRFCDGSQKLVKQMVKGAGGNWPAGCKASLIKDC